MPIMFSTATRAISCGLIAGAYAVVLQLPIHSQHNIDAYDFASGQAPIGHPVKVSFPYSCNSR